MSSRYFNLQIIILGLTLLEAICSPDVLTCTLQNARNSTTTDHCSCTKVTRSEKPRSKTDELTAPKPNKVSLSFGNQSGQLRPNIIWTINGNYVPHINGFYMTVVVRNHAPYYAYYTCNFSMAEQKNETLQLEFKECCQSFISGIGFKPEHTVSVDLHSLPLYKTTDNVYRASAEMKVPDPTDVRSQNGKRKRKRKKGRKHGTKRKRPRHDSTRMSDDNYEEHEASYASNSYILTAILATATILAVCLVICIIGGICLSKRYLPATHSAKNRRILLIGDDGDERYVKLYNGLIETLKKCAAGELEVVANVRNVSQIASTGIISWATKNIRNSDAVLFVVFSKSQIRALTDTQEQQQGLQVKKSVVGMALGIAESETLKSGFRQSRKKYIVLHTGRDSYENNLLSFCTQCLLCDDFKKVLKHALGNSYNQYVDTQDDSDYIQRQITNFTTQQPSISEPTTDLEEAVCRSATNNLNNPSEARPSLTMRNSLDRSYLYCNDPNCVERNEIV